METYKFGKGSSDNLLIQPVGDYDLSVIASEAAAIREFSGDDFQLIAVKVQNWNSDLSPWQAPAVFGNENFGNGAKDTLREILPLVRDERKKVILGGYSLAGLFALWAGYQTELFSGIAAASPSVWFPGFTEYMKQHEIKTRSVYLSLGDREEKTRNPVMSQVGNCIREAHSLLTRQKIPCCLEWNEGNHFKEPDRRTAKAFSWVICHS